MNERVRAAAAGAVQQWERIKAMTDEDRQLEAAGRAAREAAIRDEVERAAAWERLRSWASRSRALVAVHFLPEGGGVMPGVRVSVQVRVYDAEWNENASIAVNASGATEAEAYAAACEKLSERGETL